MSSAYVVVKDATVTPRKQGDYTFYSQRAILVTATDEALGIELSHREGEAAYSAGSYDIDGRSFDRDQYGRAVVSRRGLVLNKREAAAGK